MSSSCVDPTVTHCPTALAAAQALTGNSPLLPVSNAAFSGTCTVGAVEGFSLITAFGCHHLAQYLPQGQMLDTQQQI